MVDLVPMTEQCLLDTTTVGDCLIARGVLSGVVGLSGVARF
jgi:hypothetical protein